MLQSLLRLGRLRLTLPPTDPIESDNSAIDPG